MLAKPMVLSAEQQSTLLLRAAQRSARHTRRDYLIVKLLLQTGMRAGELRCLRLDQLELAGTQVLVEDEQGQRRILPLPQGLMAELTSYCQSSQLEAHDYLFPGREGGYMSVRMVQQLVTKLGRACGLELSVRVLRDSYAHDLWQQSGDLALLAERMGYRSMTSALRHIVPPRQVAEGVGDEEVIHL
jgi:integrase/recombinase XerD